MKKRKKRLEKRYYVILGLIGLFISFGVLFFFVHRDRKLFFFEKAIKDGVLFVERGFLLPIEYIQNQATEWKEKRNLYEKYQKLKEKEEGFSLLEARAKNLEQEVEQLSNLLELNTRLSETKAMNATVVNRNLDDWQSTITIDKGSRDGVEVGMAVLSTNGLVGKVTQVTYAHAVVTLLTHEKERLSVKITVGDNFLYGILTAYNEKEGYFVMEGISENTEIPEDSLVMTTGFGADYPSGIAVGKVKGSVKDHFDLARTLIIEPSTSFDTISYVTLLKRIEE